MQFFVGISLKILNSYYKGWKNIILSRNPAAKKYPTG